MASNRSAKKRIRQNEKHKARNKAVKSRLRGTAKKLRGAVADKQFDDAEKLMVTSQRLYDQAAVKGVIHKNTAARNKSRLARLIREARAAG